MEFNGKSYNHFSTHFLATPFHTIIPHILCGIPHFFPHFIPHFFPHICIEIPHFWMEFHTLGWNPTLLDGIPQFFPHSFHTVSHKCGIPTLFVWNRDSQEFHTFIQKVWNFNTWRMGIPYFPLESHTSHTTLREHPQRCGRVLHFVKDSVQKGVE